MELKHTLELQGEYGISDEDMYEWLLNMDEPLAKKFGKHIKDYQKVLNAVEAIEEKFRPGYKPHYKPETSEQLRHRADNMRTLVSWLNTNGSAKPEALREWGL